METSDKIFACVIGLAISLILVLIIIDVYRDLKFIEAGCVQQQKIGSSGVIWVKR